MAYREAVTYIEEMKPGYVNAVADDCLHAVRIIRTALPELDSLRGRTEWVSDAAHEGQLRALIAPIVATQSPLMRMSDALRAWHDLRATTGFTDWVIEVGVQDEIEKIRIDADRLWQTAVAAYDDAIRIETEARTDAVAQLAAAYRLLPDFLANSQLSARIVNQTPGLLDTRGKYHIGPPTKPELTWDNHFPYDPNATPTAADYASWNKWQAMLRGGQAARPAMVGRMGLYPSTENWQKTLGDYAIYGTSDVVVDGDQITMKIKVYAEDVYNFNADNVDIATGAPDNENGRFSTLGWAKEFRAHGEMERTVTWTIGEEPQLAGGSGPERHAPGEDRADGRSNG